MYKSNFQKTLLCFFTQHFCSVLAIHRYVHSSDYVITSVTYLGKAKQVLYSPPHKGSLWFIRSFIHTFVWI